MKIKLGCLHAHYSNIEYINDELASDTLEIVHYVDPGLLDRMNRDSDFSPAQARIKASEQLEWIARTGVDAILLTCTQYIATLEGADAGFGIPILKVDEPLFAHMCVIDGPQTLLFTNPGTVTGTTGRLAGYAADLQLNEPNAAIETMDAAVFELVMQGRRADYTNAVAARLRELLAAEPGRPVSVAQLSMVPAARLVESETGIRIGSPLRDLSALLRRQIGTGAAAESEPG